MVPFVGSPIFLKRIIHLLGPRVLETPPISWAGGGGGGKGEGAQISLKYGLIKGLIRAYLGSLALPSPPPEPP